LASEEKRKIQLQNSGRYSYAWAAESNTLFSAAVLEAAENSTTFGGCVSGRQK
jgi:hypothetical protein